MFFPGVRLCSARVSFPCRLRVVAVLGIWLLASPHGFAWQYATGYSALRTILGNKLPVGEGVPISLVEAEDGNGYYFPDRNEPQFTAVDDPLDPPAAINWINGSGGTLPPINEYSGHATNTVGKQLFGNLSSMASGANDVTVFEANDYLNIKLGFQSNSVPVTPTYAVQNHSYVSDPFSSDTEDLSLLRRLDYVIDTHDVTMTVGLNNNGNSNVDPDPFKAHPNLFAYSFNAITVGNTDAGHSRGMTDALYGPNRYRPDIVVPRPNTSSATPIVGAAATILHETLATTPGIKSEPMRAILLAGATKAEFANFVEPSTSVPNPWARTPTQPLDDLFGVGELNIYNSFRMTQTNGALKGQYAGSTLSPTVVGNHGWDYQPSITSGADVLYDFVIPAGSTAEELSIVLAWNAEIVDTDTGADFIPAEAPLANLDLRLFNSLGAEIDSSISTDYAVEHIYLTDLAAGTYTLRVSSDTNRDFGLAWRMNTLFDTPNADFSGNGLVDGTDILIWQRNYGTLAGATQSMGDANGDGAVDDEDLAVLADDYGLLSTTLFEISSSLGTTVPEPSSMLLLGMGGLSLYLLRRSRYPKRM